MANIPDLRYDSCAKRRSDGDCPCCAECFLCGFTRPLDARCVPHPDMTHRYCWKCAQMFGVKAKVIKCISCGEKEISEDPKIEYCTACEQT
jgi:hypothetical protein